MDKNSFSEELAFSVAKYSSFTKGKEYFEDGCVEKIWQEGEEYKAIVRGAHPYQVSLKFDGGELTHTCSCPFELGGACKHVVAAILAFASDKKFSSQSAQKKIGENEVIINELLLKMTSAQQRLFLEKLLKTQSSLIEELKIFLQGSQQTPVTISDYKNQFRNRLDQLDLKELLQTWYQEGEDYYDDQDYDFTGESLEEAVDELVVLGEKYEENQNFAEALKIYQALFETLSEKQTTLKGDFSDLSDWFDQEMDKVITFYVKTLGKTNDDNLRKIGVSFLCCGFQDPSTDINKEQILTGLKQIIFNQNEARYALECLSFKSKNNLSTEESSLLAFLYFLIEDWQNFENISLKNLEKNPSLTLGLLKYYQKNKNKDKIVQISGQVLSRLMKTSEDDNFIFSCPSLDYKEIEIQIRRFLKNIFPASEDYQLMIANLERLFLITGSLNDYQELIKNYHNVSEKEKFWLVIKEHFADEYEVKTIFKVFKLENQKQEILELVKKYPQAECFPEMIAFIKDNFSQECFTAYQKKIEEILKETDVNKYSEAAYHLKRMKEIKLDKEFADFVSWIKTTFWRRRRLMEELEKSQF